MGVRGAGGLLGCALLAASSASAAPLGVLTATEAATSSALELERSVARVDRSVITLSELLAEARLVLLREGGASAAERLALDASGLELVLQALAGQPAPRAAKDVGAFLSSVLASMVQRALLLSEARRLQLREISEDQVAGAYREILRLGADPRAVARAVDEAGFGASRRLAEPPPALAAVLRAELVTERLVELRAGSRASIPEAELRDCYRRRAEALGRPGFEAARGALTAAMDLARVTSRLAQLLEQLEVRVPVRYVPPFGPEPARPVDACPPAEAIREAR